MRKILFLLFFVCLPIFSKNTDRQFVKNNVSKHFGIKWDRARLHKVTDGSDHYYDIIKKDSITYLLKHIAINNYKNSRYIMAVMEKHTTIGSHAEGTELIFFEWYIDKTTDSIREKYILKIDSVGSWAESISEFRLEKISDSSSIIIYEEEFYGQGIIGKTAHILYKGNIMIFMDEYETHTNNFDPEDAVDGVDTNMIWTDIFVNPKESTIFINTTDWRDYLSSGERYYPSEYKLKNNKFVKLNGNNQ